VSAATFALASWDHVKGIDPDKVGRASRYDDEGNDSESEEKMPKKSRRSDATKAEKPAQKSEPMQTDTTAAAEAPKGDGK
jgi:hypothetical protein